MSSSGRSGASKCLLPPTTPASDATSSRTWSSRRSTASPVHAQIRSTAPWAAAFAPPAPGGRLSADGPLRPSSAPGGLSSAGAPAGELSPSSQGCTRQLRRRSRQSRCSGSSCSRPCTKSRPSGESWSQESQERSMRSIFCRAGRMPSPWTMSKGNLPQSMRYSSTPKLQNSAARSSKACRGSRRCLNLSGAAYEGVPPPPPGVWTSDLLCLLERPKSATLTS
mmetsp:Transcript_5280/g.15300  ORF Transcript_5280/g.15300 Transcript_5280/m.15300 type:complete len:223 (+) Transcript_5280:737-1405(+)